MPRRSKEYKSITVTCTGDNSFPLDKTPVCGMSSSQRRGFLSSNEASLVSVGDIVASLNADILNGLSCEEATRRLSLFGPNEFTITNDEPLWKKYLGQVRTPAKRLMSLIPYYVHLVQFKDPMIILLLVSALVSVIMGQVDDALSITAVCFDHVPSARRLWKSLFQAIVIVVTVAFVQVRT